jgi:L-ribulose-5-phosphate 4-epimerase
MLEELKEIVCQANRDLSASGLVVGTSGNVSGRDETTGLIVIKPSGVAFDALTPADMSVVDDRGTVVDGPHKPSVDTLSHAYVYRRRADVGGIVHTHSPYATSFAVRGEEIPPLTTTHAALFGGPIPVSGYAVIGEEEIGKEIVANIGDCSSILLRSHGVFTIGATPAQALRSAIYTEESAEVAHHALTRGAVQSLDAATVGASRSWYLTGYGQTAVGDGA